VHRAGRGAHSARPAHGAIILVVFAGGPRINAKIKAVGRPVDFCKHLKARDLRNRARPPTGRNFGQFWSILVNFGLISVQYRLSFLFFWVLVISHTFRIKATAEKLRPWRAAPSMPPVDEPRDELNCQRSNGWTPASRWLGCPALRAKCVFNQYCTRVHNHVKSPARIFWSESDRQASRCELRIHSGSAVRGRYCSSSN
jgi:hypothetical protein